MELLPTVNVMSVVPFTTQPGYRAPTQSSQESTRVIIVYTDKITERQSFLMKECQDYLRNLAVRIIQAKELESLPKQTRLFVIPTTSNDLLKRIRSRFENSRVYLPRAVIEAIGFRRTTLPVRRFAVSMTMHDCRIFLVKSCDVPNIRGRINEMSGVIASSFHDKSLDVVITDRADDKYCSKAFKRGIPVVSSDWVDDNYNRASEEDISWFNHEAKTTLKEHQLKPFYGLYFKSLVNDSGVQLKRLITDNQGKIIYGDQKCLTHVVVHKENSDMRADDSKNSPAKNGQKQIKTVDIDFLKTCAELGYYLTRREYREHQQMKSHTIIAKEPCTQSKTFEQPLKTIQTQNGASDSIYDNTNSAKINNHTKSASEDPPSMLPPPSVARVSKHNDIMNDIVLRGLSMFETPQTQQASTQMRGLPERNLEIETVIEPSQQLYWSDNFSSRS